jgi:drug/metabolite transporter (DMT)-like permease
VVWAEQYVASGLAALLVATVPLWMALLERLLPGGSRLTAGAATGLGLGFVGVAVLLWPKLQEVQGADLWGEAALLFAALSWAVGSIWSRRAGLAVPPLVATAWQMLLAGAFMTVVSLATGQLAHARWTGTAVAAMAYLIVFGSCLGLSAYIWLLRNAPVASVSTYAYVNPVIAVLLGWLILDEPLTPAILLGTLIIAGSVVLVTRRPTRPVAAPRPKG